jgi:hypothetical protein
MPCPPYAECPRKNDEQIEDARHDDNPENAGGIRPFISQLTNQLVAHEHPGRRQLRRARDEPDPTPGAQVAEHVVGVRDKHVWVGNGDDAIGEMEAADYQRAGPTRRRSGRDLLRDAHSDLELVWLLRTSCRTSRSES